MKTMMRHLFIINPVAKKIYGRVNKVKEAVENFFKNYPEIKYDIYISRWCRDAVAYVSRYVANLRRESGETVRIHSVGGTGTLFEVINSIPGHDGVEIAVYPYGKINSFLRYFDRRDMSAFMSFEKQVFGGTREIDMLRCGSVYGLCYGLAGLEAYANREGNIWIERGFPTDLSYMLSGLRRLSDEKRVRDYTVEIDGELIPGFFISVLAANTPSYGKHLRPAARAHPDDGKLEVYLARDLPFLKHLSTVNAYLNGRHEKMIAEGKLSCYSAKKIKISSSQVMFISVDAECFFRSSVEFEIMSGAVKLVIPEGIRNG